VEPRDGSVAAPSRLRRITRSVVQVFCDCPVEVADTSLPTDPDALAAEVRASLEQVTASA